MTKLSRYRSQTRVENDATSIDLSPTLKTVVFFPWFQRTSLIAKTSAILRPSEFPSSHRSSVCMRAINDALLQNFFRIVIPVLENVPSFGMTTPVGYPFPCVFPRTSSASANSLSGGLSPNVSGSVSLNEPCMPVMFVG